MSVENNPREPNISRLWALALSLAGLGALTFFLAGEHFLCAIAGIAWIIALWRRQSFWSLVSVFGLLCALGSNSLFLNFFYDRYIPFTSALIGIYSTLICLTWLRCREKLDPNWAWSGIFVTLPTTFFAFGLLFMLIGLIVAAIMPRKSDHPRGLLPSSAFINFTVIACIALILVAMLLPPSGQSRVSYQKSQITKCKNNLKQIGLMMQSYYSDGTATAMPILKRFEVDSRNDGGFGFDANMLSCSAEHKGPSRDFVWNPKISGTFAEWNNPHSPWIWDATPHHYSGKVNVLFGDGHVEELTPERLKELTK